MCSEPQSKLNKHYIPGFVFLNRHTMVIKPQFSLQEKTLQYFPAKLVIRIFFLQVISLNDQLIYQSSLYCQTPVQPFVSTEVTPSFNIYNISVPLFCGGTHFAFSVPQLAAPSTISSFYYLLTIMPRFACFSQLFNLKLNHICQHY